MSNSVALKNSRLRIVHLVDGLREGGAERQAVQLACRLHRMPEFDVSFACLNGDGVLRQDLETAGLGDIEEYPLNSFYGPSALRQTTRFVRFLRQQGVRIVHTHDFYSNIFGIVGAFLARVPVRIAERLETRGIRSDMRRRAELAAFKVATAVVANSRRVVSELVEERVPSRKIRVVHNGLAPERVVAPSGLDRTSALRRLGLPTDEGLRFVTIVANLRLPVKDHPTFLRAAQRIARAVPNARFVVAGEGPLRDSLQRLADQLGIAHRTFFLGQCDDIPLLLFVSDIGMLTSKAEGFSNSLLEYMAAGLPVVATNVGGADEIIVPGDNGYLADVGDDASIAQHALALLNDPGRARQMGERGRAIVGTRFSADAQAATVARLYRELTAS